MIAKIPSSTMFVLYLSYSAVSKIDTFMSEKLPKYDWEYALRLFHVDAWESLVTAIPEAITIIPRTTITMAYARLAHLATFMYYEFGQVVYNLDGDFGDGVGHIGDYDRDCGYRQDQHRGCYCYFRPVGHPADILYETITICV